MAISHRQLKALMSDIDGIYGLPTHNTSAGNCELQRSWCRVDPPRLQLRGDSARYYKRHSVRTNPFAQNDFSSIVSKQNLVNQVPHHADASAMRQRRDPVICGVGPFWRKTPAWIANRNRDFLCICANNAANRFRRVVFAPVQSGIGERFLYRHQQVDLLFFVRTLPVHKLHDLLAMLRHLRQYSRKCKLLPPFCYRMLNSFRSLCKHRRQCLTRTGRLRSRRNRWLPHFVRFRSKSHL